MAWLTEMAGRAENLLNQLDQVGGSIWWPWLCYDDHDPDYGDDDDDDGNDQLDEDGNYFESIILREGDAYW